jgi:intraflagellar transport protein 56
MNYHSSMSNSVED